jgi:hypothetical protein
VGGSWTCTRVPRTRKLVPREHFVAHTKTMSDGQVGVTAVFRGYPSQEAVVIPQGINHEHVLAAMDRIDR